MHNSAADKAEKHFDNVRRADIATALVNGDPTPPATRFKSHQASVKDRQLQSDTVDLDAYLEKTGECSQYYNVSFDGIYAEKEMREGPTPIETCEHRLRLTETNFATQYLLNKLGVIKNTAALTQATCDLRNIYDLGTRNGKNGKERETLLNEFQTDVAEVARPFIAAFKASGKSIA